MEAAWVQQVEDDPFLPFSAEDLIDAHLARAEVAAAHAAIAMAEQLAAIDDTLRDAADFPDVFVGVGHEGTAQSLEFARRAAVAELAVALGISEATIQVYASSAHLLRTRMPEVWAAFREGRFGYQKARIIVEQAETMITAGGSLEKYDTIMRDAALRFTPAKLRAKARAERERLHPQPIEVRHTAARDERRVWVDPAPDGMAWLGAFLPADAACRAYARIEATARHLLTQTGETRTLGQLRADVAADLLTGDGTDFAVRSTVLVTVPVLRLLATSSEPCRPAGPAVLDGYGPIDPDTARRLTAAAPSFYRVLTDPVKATVLDVDRTRYRPPADLQRLVRTRFPRCTFPGCNRTASECDIDHSVDWAFGGTTADDNLAPLCRHHHRVKHLSRWRMRRGADGAMRWTSPAGRNYPGDPPPF